MTDITSPVEAPDAPPDPETAEAPQPSVSGSPAGLSVEPAPARRIAIVGYTNSKNDAPWDDPAFERWICNDLHKYVPDKWDRLYDLHDQKTIDGDPDHAIWLTKNRRPAYVWEPRPEWPGSIRYPREEAVEAFGRYFTNSISWMIAHAIIEACHSADDWASQQAAAVIESNQGLSPLHDVLAGAARVDFLGRCQIHVYGVDMAQGCLAPETRVLTADLRWVTHDEVRVGDKLLAFDEHAPGEGRYRKYRTATVEAVRHHVQHCHRIVFADGTKIIASDDHPWLVNSSNTRRWLATNRLEPETVKGRPSQVVKLFEPWEMDRSWGSGYLSAAIDAEGHLSGRTLGFSQRDNAFARQVIHEAARRGFRFDGAPDATGCVKYQLAGGKREVARFLGEVRPVRLLAGFRPEQFEALASQRAAHRVPVVAIEDIGMHETIGLQVDTRTYVAEGFATHNTEYAAQRPSCEYFLGLARGMGIQTFVPLTSDLLKNMTLYGAEDDTAIRAKMDDRIADLERRMAELQGQAGQIGAHINQCQGALEDTRYWRGVWLNAAANRDGSAKGSEPAQSDGQGTIIDLAEPVAVG